MTYQVLARKWRPKNFSTLVGQEHVTRAIINALENQRLHHAYLFTGTRGVGKTTIARILAKCLNCKTGVTATPCETCETCVEINEGRFVDLIEVDAASRTKVEDTRELLENVHYLPVSGRYKIYLIDEVHMLSNHSFNALLKTLEEPPAHVKFLLATTDPQRLPVTVLSRCLQFNLKRLSIETISKHLRTILESEKISYEANTILPLARGADGSLRDALSLLDQAIAYCNGELKTQLVHDMLGTFPQDRIINLLTYLDQNNAVGLLQEIANLAELNTDFNAALEELLSILHQVTIAQFAPEAIHSNLFDSEQIKLFAKCFTPETIQLYYQIGLIGRRDLPLAPTAREGFEMVLLRMLAFQPQDITEPAPKASKIQKTQPTKVTAPIVEQKSTSSASSTDWPNIINAMGITGPTLLLANHCQLLKNEDSHIQLSLSPANAPLHTKLSHERLQDALSKHFTTSIKLTIHQTEPSTATPAQIQHTQNQEREATAREKLQNDANIQSLLTTFNAKIKTGTVKLLDGKVNLSD